MPRFCVDDVGLDIAEIEEMGALKLQKLYESNQSILYVLYALFESIIFFLTTFVQKYELGHKNLQLLQKI